MGVYDVHVWLGKRTREWNGSFPFMCHRGMATGRTQNVCVKHCLPLFKHKCLHQILCIINNRSQRLSLIWFRISNYRCSLGQISLTGYIINKRLYQSLKCWSRVATRDITMTGHQQAQCWLNSETLCFIFAGFQIALLRIGGVIRNCSRNPVNSRDSLSADIWCTSYLYIFI